MTNNEKKYRGFLLISTIVLLVAGFKVLRSTPTTHEGKILTSDATIFQDSTLIEDRQYGLVNLEKFVNLASLLGSSHFNDESVVYNDDSVTFKVLSGELKQIFFSDYSNSGDLDEVISKCPEFPITVGSNSFTAHVEEIDGTKYLSIPYFVLSSLANYVSSKNVVKIEEPKSTNKKYQSDDNNGSIEHEMPEGKIQTEGMIRKNFFDIQAKKNHRRSSNAYTQLELAWKYVKDNWQYIHDPRSDVDTWRSAYETIQDYYSNGNKVYCGDCDDFAILMASFARQVGYDSRCVCVHGAEGGHMYAQFYDENNGGWCNLDWFSDDFNDTPYQGTIVAIYK